MRTAFTELVGCELPVQQAPVGSPAAQPGLGSRRVSVPRFSPDNPPLDATGRVDAMALYAGQGVGAVRRREPAAAIVADLVSRLGGEPR